MTNRPDRADRPRQLAWVRKQLTPGEYVLSWTALHGGISAEMSRLTIGARTGHRRGLVLRTYPGPLRQPRVERLLNREAGALTFLAETAVPAPALVAVDPEGAECEYPSLLMTLRPGRPVLDQQGIETRVPLLARQLVAIHELHPAQRPPVYEALTTPDTVVVPPRADPAAWAGAIDVIRRPAPSYAGRFLHRDFHPGNVLFDQPSSATSVRIAGVVDWQAPSWGPADLDVAHCCTNLALLHGPDWGLRFADAYERAGGTLAAATSERRYWLVRDALAASEELRQVSQPWREAGRTELTTRAVEDRLDAYVISLMDVGR